MTDLISEQNGEFLLALSRRSIEEFLNNKKVINIPYCDIRLLQKQGVFCTIRDPNLRGRVGIPFPSTKLIEGVIHSSLGAAFDDSRFKPLTREELDGVLLEISVLTEPERLIGSPQHIPKLIEIGNHGVIVKNGKTSALLLPEVALEYGWDEVEFLQATCQSSGMPPNTWKKSKAQVFTFEQQVFREMEEALV